MKTVNRIFIALVTASVLAVSGGCASHGSALARQGKSALEDADIIGASHAVASALAKNSGLPKGASIIVASFADINALEVSSPFGRITSQQVASALSGMGYNVIELLLRNNVYIKSREGEFLLSRQVKNLVLEHDAAAVLTGTYAVGSKRVYVTAKLIRTADNVVLAAYDYNLPLGPDTRRLLRQR